MKETSAGLPILFTAPMIRALDAGRKTQMRRAIGRLRKFGKVTEFGPSDTRGYDWLFRDRRMCWNDVRHARLLEALPYAVGDRLWAREAHYLTDNGHCELPVYAADRETVAAHLASVEVMKADPRFAAVWRKHARLRPAMHMPRWASRFTLTVTDARVQRLNEISEDDAQAEGLIGRIVEDCDGDPRLDGRPNRSTQWHWDENADFLAQGVICARLAYELLWNRINGPGAWGQNPFVAAYTFTIARRNIDEAAP